MGSSVGTAFTVHAVSRSLQMSVLSSKKFMAASKRESYSTRSLAHQTLSLPLTRMAALIVRSCRTLGLILSSGMKVVRLVGWQRSSRILPELLLLL